jgi:hypothetical protein
MFERFEEGHLQKLVNSGLKDPYDFAYNRVTGAIVMRTV